MTKALIIVESPAKIKTLKKFLGKGYSFESSVGHIRDLPQKGFGIDVENDFEPEYDIVPGKQEIVSRLKSAAKAADIVYLSPDPDREGEAIAWHISEILPKNTKIKRVTFNAITKDAVLEALEHPRSIDQALVDAQQARRLLDRIVGYKISPILMRKVQGARDGGLSAGRVQSVALKLVVDREKEIEAFIPIEYWNLAGLFSKQNDKTAFEARLYSVDGLKIEKEKDDKKEILTIPNELTAREIQERIKKGQYKVEMVEKKEKRRNAPPPFITSTLQQEASRHLGFSPTRTMKFAQTLYEGVEGAEGLITYMRTDSVRVAPEAIAAARAWVEESFGTSYLPPTGKQYTTGKSAQDAHEAIRPTQVSNTPSKVRDFLSPEEYKLYLLIWNRFIASQMNPAVYDTITCDIESQDNIKLRATGSTLRFPGFLALYEEKEDEEKEKAKEGEEAILPPLEEGEPLRLLDVKAEQAFTRPPPRFTEASLVKELERCGIGRPSTYATIMQKIQSRDYTEKEKGMLKPTELGRVIAQLLEAHFKLIMDIGFTAAMEDELERIAENRKNWKELLRDFWKDFIPTVKEAEKAAFVPRIATDRTCPQCGNKLEKIWSRKRYFYGCSTYPTCNFTSPLEALDFKKEEYAPNFNWDQACPKCGCPMKLRHGRFGPFLGCSTFPKCRGLVSIPSKEEANLPGCPAMGCDGKLEKRRSRFGKAFYSCSNYPDCDAIGSTVDALVEKYQDRPKTAAPPRKKFEKKGKKEEKSEKPEKGEKKAKVPKRAGRAVGLSKELQEFLGKDELSRGEVVKEIWIYIKENSLQDKKNKRTIVPDSKMAKVFGKKPFDMMQLAKLLKDHIK